MDRRLLKRIEFAMGKIFNLLVFVGIGISLGCKRDICVEISKDTPLLAKPYPMEYKQGNKVIKNLAPGRYSASSGRYGKDFLVYTVQVDSVKGYVIHDADAHACESEKR